MTNPNPSIQEQINSEAIKRYPFIWPKNKYGETIEQRVGQKNPPGSAKAKKIQGIFINGAEYASSLYEPRIQELEKEIEKCLGLLTKMVTDTSFTQVQETYEQITEYINTQKK